MEVIKILIVEDEPIIADDIGLILEDEGFVIVGKPASAEKALEILKSSEVDLVLLDIMLQGDMDGITLGEAIFEHLKIPFLYLTSLSDKDTLDKIKSTRPNGFLVKPINERELLANIELAIYNYKEDQSERSITYPKEYFVRDKKRMVKIKAEQILFLEASDNYCYVHTKDRKYIVAQTMKKIQAFLNPDMFCRIHKSYLVNLTKITHLETGSVGIEGDSIPIGRAYKEDFMNKVKIL